MLFRSGTVTSRSIVVTVTQALLNVGLATVQRRAEARRDGRVGEQALGVGLVLAGVVMQHPQPRRVREVRQVAVRDDRWLPGISDLWWIESNSVCIGSDPPLTA